MRLALGGRQRESGAASSPGLGEGGRASGSSFPPSARILVLISLLLLSAYTVFAGLRVRHEAGQASSVEQLRPDVESLAARASIHLAPLKAAAEATAALGGARADDPLLAAETALTLAGGKARAAAIVRGGALLASTRSTEGLNWFAAARELAGAKGAASPDPLAGFLYIGAPIRIGGESAELMLAIDQNAVIAPPADGPGRIAPKGETVMLVKADGKILAMRPPGKAARASEAPETAGSGYSLTTLFGVNLAQLSGGREKPLETVLTTTGGGRPLRLALSPTGVAGLSAVATAPVDAVSATVHGSVADDTVSLLAPLAIGLALAIVVFRQTRKAEEAQAERYESERRFRNAVEAARCGIWEWRLNEDKVYLSDVTGVMFGWGGGGVAQGAEVIARIAPEHTDRVRRALTDAARHGAFDVTFKVPGPNGAAWIDARGQGFGPTDESGYKAILGVALDVTQERMAQARAVSAEARLNDAIESVSEAFVLWDRGGRLIMCNHNYSHFFGLDPKLLKPGARLQTIRQIANNSVRSRLPAPDGNPGVREEEMMDGRWLQISERRTSDGGVVMTAADITALKRQEAVRRLNESALQQAVLRLEEKSAELAELADKYEQEKIRAQQANAAQSEFLANMSHELRTPLNAINGFSEMMAMELLGPLGDKRYKEYANDILTSGQHLLSVINDILDMAKIEAGKTSLHLEAVDLATLIHETVRLMRNRVEAARLTLTLELGAPPAVEADGRAIKQVLLNLLSNAVKFTPPGGRIKISCRVGIERIRISVMDTGIGIDKTDLDRLARPFEQVESQHSKTTQGTGLGLALSKSLIEMHEGRFEMASESGRGTTVSFTLPLRQRKALEKPGADSAVSSANVSG